LIEAAAALALALGVGEWAIGVTVVAAGTSAPEFVGSLVGGADRPIRHQCGKPEVNSKSISGDPEV